MLEAFEGIRKDERKFLAARENSLLLLMDSSHPGAAFFLKAAQKS
jgi:hypothetical protein